MATAQTELGQTDRMPSDLRDRGWKLEEKRINDGDPDYLARNEALGIQTEAYPIPFAAIEAARKLDARATVGKDSAPKVSFRNAVTFDLEIAKIRIDGGTQPREELDQETVDRYAEAMEAGAEFPPAKVFHDGEFFWLADGFHRRAASVKIDRKTLRSEVNPGTQRDAILYSLGANAIHGLPRSNADKRRAVQTMLEDLEWSGWSDSVIAQKANVSQPFVSTLRRALTQNVLSEPEEEPESAFPGTIRFLEERVAAAPSTKRRGRDGVLRETKNIGRTARTIPEELDIEVEPAPAAPVATATPATARPEPDGWLDAPLNLHVQINAGKTTKRQMLVSGRHGEGKPIFLQFTAADLEPMPPALTKLIEDLKKAVARKRPAAPKSPGEERKRVSAARRARRGATKAKAKKK